MDVTEFNQESPVKLDGTNGSGDINSSFQQAADSPALKAPDDGQAHRQGRNHIAADEPTRGAVPATEQRQNGNHTPRRQRGADSDHFKRVPTSSVIRENINATAEELTRTLPKAHALNKDELERLGRDVLQRTGQPEQYLGFAMVLVGNSFWRSQFLATPFERRLLLLPGNSEQENGHFLEQTDSPPGMESHRKSVLLRSRQSAERLGYQVLQAERSSAVLKIILNGSVDAICGVATMDVLERAIDKVLIAGVPSYVVPLPSAADMPADLARENLPETDWLEPVLDRFEPREVPRSVNYVRLMRAANSLFSEEFVRLLPRARSSTPETAASPLGYTEDIAYKWLAHGGKRFRPFITLAAYQAARQNETQNGGAEWPFDGQVPDSVCRVAMAIEVFHKASLVHDDIQDDDQFRYGDETLHRLHGVGTAINIGDYLIGLGYQLVNRCAADLGTDVATEIIDSMAAAHIKLCDGQGAEMSWQSAPDWSITPGDALQIYALKTSPAFEAALFAGLRMAGPIDEYAGMIPDFARHLGVGFQVINDLKDWQGDADNKLIAGQDALAIRPTMLLALALDAADHSRTAALRDIYQSQGCEEMRLEQLSRLFRELGAFSDAFTLIQESRTAALELADGIPSQPLRRLLGFLVDTVLAQGSLRRQSLRHAGNAEISNLAPGR